MIESYNNPACEAAVEELLTNNDLSSAQIVDRLKGQFQVSDIHVAISHVLMGKPGFYSQTSDGKTKRGI